MTSDLIGKRFSQKISARIVCRGMPDCCSTFVDSNPRFHSLVDCCGVSCSERDQKYAIVPGRCQVTNKTCTKSPPRFPVFISIRFKYRQRVRYRRAWLRWRSAPDARPTSKPYMCPTSDVGTYFPPSRGSDAAPSASFPEHSSAATMSRSSMVAGQALAQ